MPDLANSPFETARFADPADRRHSVIVLRGPLSPEAAVYRAAPDQASAAVRVAERTQAVLEAAGFGDFEITGTQVAGHAGARLDGARVGRAPVDRAPVDRARLGTGRTWTVREYFVIRDGVRFVLGCGSYVPDEDDSLFTALAERFEILSPP
ncbi:MAG TPA: hypothetical protein VGM79_12335 [Streptosporangiaceae bacterium]